MADVSIKYRGSEIANMSATGSKTLGTQGKYCDSDVVVEYTKPASTVIESNKNATPSESQQEITPSSGYDAMAKVTVAAVSSSYVGTEVPRRSLADVTASGARVIVPAGFYESQVIRTVATGTAGTPTATKGTVSNHSVSVTPAVTNTTGYINGSTQTGTPVTVTASELVSGEKEITANGTGIDVANYATVKVSVPTGGGASNLVQGTFTTHNSAGAQSISIPYTGSGYPIMVVVVVNGGAYNSAISGWYNSMQRYAVGQYTMTKAVMTSAPTYGTSGTQNQGVTTAIYKNSTSSSTSYTRTSAMNTNAYSSSNASNSAALCVRMMSAKSMSVYVNTSSYGLLPNTEYAYYIVYSS